MMRVPQKAFFIVSIFLAIFLLSFSTIGLNYAYSGGADQPDFPNIYIDAGCAGTKVGSEDNPYDDISDINWTAGGDNSIADYLAGSPSASPTIHLNKSDTWRETLTPGCSGTATYPIVITSYGSGNAPIILGSEEVIGVSGDWTDEGGDVWSRALATECENVVFDSTNYGIEDATPDASYEWDWVANELFVYSVGNPTGVYTSIEAGQRDYCIRVNKDYITIEDITCKYPNDNGILCGGTNTNLTIDGCDISYTDEIGIRVVTPAGTVLINDFTVSYTGQSGIQISVNALATVTISDGTVSHSGQAGNSGHSITIPDSTSITISNCTLSDGLGSGIGGDGYESCTIENNTIYNHQWHGIDLSADTDHDCKNNIVRYNLVYDNGLAGGTRAGIILYTHETAGFDTNANQVYYNLVYGHPRGIKLYGNVHDNLIYNNTVYDNDENFTLNFNTGEANFFPTDNILKNNIGYIVDAGDYSVKHGSDNTRGNVFDYNCWHPDQTACFSFDGVDKDTLAAWQVASSQDANSINTDPKLKNPTTDFHLLMASPCTDAGTDVSLITDYEGLQVRHAPDIGAYENQTNVIFQPESLLAFLMLGFFYIANKKARKT